MRLKSVLTQIPKTPETLRGTQRVVLIIAVMRVPGIRNCTAVRNRTVCLETKPRIGRFRGCRPMLNHEKDVDMKSVLIIVSVAIVSAWIPSTFAGESNGGGKSRPSAIEDVIKEHEKMKIDPASQ